MGSHIHKNSGQKKRKFFNNQKKRYREEQLRRQTVTDHAVVRYLERKYGLDIDAIHKEILADKLPIIQQLEKGKVKNGDIELVFENRVVVTVEPAD